MYLSRSVCLSVSQPSFSPPKYLLLSYSLCLWLSCSVYLSVSPSAGLSLSLFLLSFAVLCRPLSYSLFFPSCICLFSIPCSTSCLLRMHFFFFFTVALLHSIRLLLCFLSSLPLSCAVCLSVSLSHSPSVSPDIHVEIFSHVRYRFTTPARSPWPLNLIPSTKPHCFLCVWACLLCVTMCVCVCSCITRWRRVTFKGLAWVRWAQRRNLQFIEAQRPGVYMCACISVRVCVCV